MNHLPNTSEEADERLIIALEYYVLEREMPIRAAKCLMTNNIKDKSKLKETWKRFLTQIRQRA